MGHFDYIRIYDPNYASHLAHPDIWPRILRNLELVQEAGMILDFNTRALSKGAAEPYVSRPILEEALDRDIPLVPGDDSHGVASVGLHTQTAIEILRSVGASTDWKKPGL